FIPDRPFHRAIHLMPLSQKPAPPQFTELMFKMSDALGFDFDRVQLMRGAYYPRGHGELEERQRKILVRLEQILEGERPLPITIDSSSSLEFAKIQTLLTAR
ncbi:DUF6680 family protein, partial [Nitrobacter sp.]|uniref:DUF6680 family protein n=1 Tax=Nitrobacter sp. TaxID=29420 RepID=UPI00321FE7D5